MHSLIAFSNFLHSTLLYTPHQESWAEAIKGERSEVSIRAHLEGNLKVLKPITGEGVYNKLAADIRTVSALLHHTAIRRVF